jgi:hypothetical protein
MSHEAGQAGSGSSAGSGGSANPGGNDVTREDEVIPEGQPTESSQGVGAVYGDAERSSIDEPVTPPNEADAEAIRNLAENYTVQEGSGGERYIEENPTE